MEDSNSEDVDMTKISEEVIVSPAMRIKEQVITLNTLDVGSASEVTDVINGELECVIIVAEKPIQALIHLEEYPNIVLFSTINDSISGSKYLPLRLFAISEKNERFTYTDAKWTLNNKVRCTVSGYKNATVQIILRYR